MGIIAKQASRNLIFIVLGFFAGAVNTLFVLPSAFETTPENWGLLRSLIAWFMILSQIFSFGSTSILIRYYPKLRHQAGALLKFSLSLVLIGIGALGILLYFFGPALLSLSSGEHVDLLKNHLGLLFVLTSVFILFLTFQGYVNAILKSSFHQFLNETFLKSYYLAIALLFLFQYLSFGQLLIAFALGYMIALLALVVYSISCGFTLKSQTGKLEQKGEMLQYGMFSILDRGAQTIVNNLDIIMIGFIIGLDDVGFFTLAAFIGTVTQMPQRAIQVIANPIVSKAIADKDHEELKTVYEKSSLTQLILGGGIFLAIWASIDELMLLMPGNYGQGKWVVLFIAISKLIYIASGVSGGIIVYSKYYKINLIFNSSLIVLTIATNYFLISPEFFDLGIEGAAIATAISYLIYNMAKIALVKAKFGISPWSYKTGIVILLFGILATMFHSWQLFLGHEIYAIAIKSGLSLLVFFGIIYGSKISPDLNRLVKLK